MITLPTFHTPAGASRIRPTRDWLAVLAVTLVLIIASVVYNLTTFYSVTQGAARGTDSLPKMSRAISSEKVERVFLDRATEREKYVHAYQFVDPSGVSR